MHTLFILAAGAAFVLCGCAGTEFAPKPAVEISRFDIDSLSLRDITFVFDLSITNPYPVGLDLESVKMDFFVEGNEAFSTTSSEGLKIPAKNKAASSFLVTLRYADVIAIVSDYAQKDYLSTVVKTEITIPLPEIPGLPPSLKFSYDLEKKIPAVKPRVSISGFRVQQPNPAEIAAALKAAGQAAAQSAVSAALNSILTGKAQAAPSSLSLADLDLPLTVSFDIELANETAARLDFTQLDYEFAVNGSPLVKGLAKDIKRTGNLSVLSVVSSFSTKNLGSTLIGAFQSGQGDFSLTGGTAVQFPKEIRGTPVPLRFTEKGKFNLR
jgi:LEA14-like dessication related protein